MTAKKMTKTKETKKTSAIKAVSAQDLNIDAQKRSSSTVSFAIWVRTLRQNWRQGTVGCKGRSDVSFSNKKPWKQKGTGRARAGSPRSPLWRGGGVIFGPQPRVRTLKASKSMKRGVMNSMLFDFLENNKITCLDWTLSADRPRTSEAFNAIKQAGLAGQKLTLFVTANDILSQASMANIPNVKILLFDQPNAFDLINCDRWIYLKKDQEQFKEMVSQWI